MSRRKALGQHFLVNRSALNKIIEVISPRKDELIIEIGPGRGALTFPLAEKAGKVIAVEKDESLIPGLQNRGIPNLEVIFGDILKVDLQKILKGEGRRQGRVKLVGNLPYSISSSLLFKVLDWRDIIEECVFLLQKEVAERICASSGSKDYAPLSILLQIGFLCRLHLRLSPRSFFPPPGVDSALVSLKKREVPLFPMANPPRFQKFLRLVFQHRRKTLANNLKKSGIPPGRIAQAFLELSLPENIRPEELPIRQMVALHGFLDRATGGNESGPLKKKTANLH